MGFEWSILNGLQGLRTPAGDIIMPFISKLGNAGMIWLLLAVILLLRPKSRKSGMILFAALCVDIVLCNGILKNVFQRVRPCNLNPSVSLLIARPQDFSFPSGHTAASFAAVAALYFSGEKKLWKTALVLAGLIAFSRLYLYVHYPTDILGGILVGVAAGYAGFVIVQKMVQWKSRQQTESTSTGRMTQHMDLKKKKSAH